MPRKPIDVKTNKEIEKSILSKKSPQQIAEELKVSIAHVHNVKKDMEKRGVKIPEIRKGRPWPSKAPGEPNATAQAVYGTSKKIKENLSTRKKSLTMDFKSFPRMAVHLVFTNQDITVYYGDTSQTIKF